MSTQRADGVSAGAEEQLDGEPSADTWRGTGRSRAGGASRGPRRRGRDPRGGSDLTARILVAIPRRAVALALVIDGGRCSPSACFVVGGAVPARALRDVRAGPAGAPGGLIALAALLPRRSAGGPVQVLLWP